MACLGALTLLGILLSGALALLLSFESGLFPLTSCCCSLPLPAPHLLPGSHRLVFQAGTVTDEPSSPGHWTLGTGHPVCAVLVAH